MSDYINKVKTADGNEYDVQDKRIEAIYTQAEKEKLSRVQEVFTTEEKVKLDNIKSIETNDGKLIIDVVKAPTPVAEFDGIKYYHKQEFDLEELAAQFSGTDFHINPLSGEIKDNNRPSIRVSSYGSQMSGQARIIDFLVRDINNLHLYTNWSGVEVNYTSRSFTVVQQQFEVIDDTKICLPGCSAYYGYFNANTNKFISYYNLIDELIEPITKISDGTNEVDIQDSRVDSLQSELNSKQDKIVVTQEDIGKVVGVNENGELALINVGSENINYESIQVESPNGVARFSNLLACFTSFPVSGYYQLNYMHTGTKLSNKCFLSITINNNTYNIDAFLGLAGENTYNISPLRIGVMHLSGTAAEIGGKCLGDYFTQKDMWKIINYTNQCCVHSLSDNSKELNRRNILTFKSNKTSKLTFRKSGSKIVSDFCGNMDINTFFSQVNDCKIVCGYSSNLPILRPLLSLYQKTENEKLALYGTCINNTNIEEIKICDEDNFDNLSDFVATPSELY